LKKEYEIEVKKFEEKMKKKEEEFEKKWEKYDSFIVDKTMNLTEKEQQQLESWTSKKCTEIVFDTNRDGYPKDNTNTFEMKVKNRSNLMFIVEDTNGNKFGGYLNTKIDHVDGDYYNDSNAFVFTLKSPGRNLGMRKFGISNSSYAFYLYNQSSSYLFLFGYGYDISIQKENNKTLSYCCQSSDRSYNYEGIDNALIPNANNQQKFTPQRITVIQMK
jgi:hypothetical protein